ncbi:hypothetical protein GCM10010174_80770 [Kutzneria viridogrisea]|uniref:Uncharacterized protein n=1 Tax=Kutzneria viridogrisea TaxID=47990 RepID=A0ABR6BZR5_9PSEU|nr:hypothetical protein [Kutzneria viridogrisea]
MADYEITRAPNPGMPPRVGAEAQQQPVRHYLGARPVIGVRWRRALIGTALLPGAERLLGLWDWVVHLALAPGAGAGEQTLLTAYCGMPMLLGEVDIVARVEGMPCARCVISIPLDASTAPSQPPPAC